MANTIGFGQAAVNNTIDYGQGAIDNTINWGKSQTLSPSGETNITGTGGTPPFSNLQSILLDGVDDFVDCGSVSAINSASTVSVSYWGKKTASNKYLLVGSQMSSTNGIWLIWWNDGNVYFAARNGNIGFAGYALSFDTNFHHFVGVYNGSSLKIYIDGILRATSTTSIPSTLSSTAGNDFNIGYLQSQYASGNIDEVSVFNSELSASDVTAIYGSGVPSSLSSYSSLVSWWRFEGSGTTANDSGSGGNDGTLVNGVTRSTDVPTIPFSTKSIALDGVDEYVDVGVLSSIESQAWSISLWVKWNALDGTNEAIISTRQNGLGSATGIDLNITDGGGKLRARTYKATSGGIGAELIVTLSSVGITTGVWYHIAVTYASSTLNMKINDGAIYSGTDSGTYVASGASAYLGNWRKSNALHNGYIDEVGIFDAELSASDITAIYNSGVPTSLSSYSSLTNWWRCGDGDTAPTLTDNGSGGNDGTMTNFTTFSTDVPT